MSAILLITSNQKRMVSPALSVTVPSNLANTQLWSVTASQPTYLFGVPFVKSPLLNLNRQRSTLLKRTSSLEGHSNAHYANSARQPLESTCATENTSMGFLP